MRVSRMKQCSAFVINSLFLSCSQQYKGLRFSKLTLSQMGNKAEQHTQKCLWYCFFHLICIHCINVAGRPSLILFIYLFIQKDHFNSLRCMISSRSGSPTSFSLSPHEAPPSLQPIFISIQLILCKHKSTSITW